MVAPMNNGEIDALCQDWVRWCATRKFYIRPASQNILARMQPSKSGREPNARNDPDMQFFNMAVHALFDMPEHKDDANCFRFLYVEQASNIKVIVDRMEISRPTYYNRARAFARKAHSMSISIKRVREMQAQNEALSID